MKVLVTGGSGKIGQYVVDELLDKHEVTILDAKPSQKHPQVPFIHLDLAQLLPTLKAIDGFDAVVHLAAIPSPGVDDWDHVLSSNTAATHNVLEAMRENGIVRIIYASSVSGTGYGIRRIDHKPLYLPLDEAHPCWPHEAYSLSKYFGEIMCQEYSRAYGIEAISLRFSWVWFDEERDGRAESIKKGYVKERLFGDYVFASDVATACRLSLDHEIAGDPKHDVFFITAENNCMNVDYMAAFHAIFGEDIPPVDEDYFARDPQRSISSICKAKSQLGWCPQHLWQEWL